MSRSVIQLRVAETDRAAWQASADAVGLSVSEWIRQRCSSPAGLSEPDLSRAEVRDLAKLPVAAAAAALARTYLEDRDVISTWDRLIAYLRVSQAHDGRESARVLYLDKKNALVGEDVTPGTVDHCPLYPREIARRALDLDASAVILAHNHPSGDPAPSRGDIEMTKQVDSVLRALGITLHDHVIVATGGHFSFRAQGLL